MKRPRCNFIHDSDVIGAMNMVRRYLLNVSDHAVDFPMNAHDPHVEWFVATMKRGVEAQPALAKPTMT